MREHIEQMRQRLGLDENDTSRDTEIEKMAPIQRLRLLSGWHLGYPEWADTFLSWARASGFKIEEPRP